MFSASKKDADDLFKGEIPNAKFFLVKHLENLSKACPGKIPILLSQLSVQCQTHLQTYLNESNIILQ